MCIRDRCPRCGNPYSLNISIEVDKETDRRSAKVVCSSCGFSYVFEEIPVVADEFWVYARILDMTRQGAAEEAKTVPEAEVAGGIASDTAQSTEVADEGPPIEFEEESEEKS